MKTNCASIPLSTVFSGQPIFPHGIMGIFVSMGATIGKNVIIMHQVTIGSNTFADSKNIGAPIIGDNVFIGTGAKIIGAVSIGNNVRIGANCVVSTNIPDNATVVLNQPRLITHDGTRDNRFISWDEYRTISAKIK